MHQPCRLVIFWWRLKDTATMPWSRPPGRRILYATWTVFLILSADRTVMFFSEYRSTASVFSSCAGSWALTSACIHCGASPPATASGTNTSSPAATPSSDRTIFRLVAGARRTRLQDDLFLIAGSHHLEKIPERRIVLWIQEQNIHEIGRASCRERV